MSKSSIKVITFDLDNTLWDAEPVLRRAESEQNTWLQKNRPRVSQQFDPESMWKFRLKTHESHPELAHQISKIRVQALYEVQLHCGYSEELARAGAEAAFEAFLAVRHQVEPYERALEVLEELAQQYVLGALSNGNADVFKLDIGEYFDFAFSAEQLNDSKQLPEMLHAGLQSAAAEAHKVIHVGDNPTHDIEAARNLGMHTNWMNSGNWSWPGGQPADEEIRLLEDLPLAIRRIESRVNSDQ